MKILYIVYQYYPLYSGYAIKISRLCQELKKKGFNPTVLSVRLKGMRRFEKIDEIPVYRIFSLGFKNSFTRFRRISLIFSLMCYILFHLSKFDILHTVGNDWGIFVAIGLARLFRKNVVHSLSMYGEDNPAEVRSSKLGKLKLILMNKANKIFCSSTALFEDCRRLGILSEKIAKVPNGVDTNVFIPAPNSKSFLRKKYHIPEDHQVLVFLGSVIRRKGVDFLLDVFSKLSESFNYLFLVVIGSKSLENCPFLDGKFFKLTKAKVREYKLKECIRFTGRITNMQTIVEYLQLSDIFVLPTQKEGSPNALLEAMACGLPSVVTHLKGVTDDIIHSGNNGILVPLKVSAFVRSIKELLGDPERRNELGKRARETILKKHSFSTFVGKHIMIYNSLKSRA